MKPDASLIKEKIKVLQNEEKAAWLENYVKHDIKSLGVGIPDIRKILKETNKSYGFTTLRKEEQTDVLDDLMEEPWTEFKLAAILYIQVYWKEKLDENKGIDEILQLISGWFDRKLISDWNVCDWLCVRLLSPVLDTHPEQAKGTFSKWNNADYLWKARASLVPFAQCKTIGMHQKEIFEFSSELIRREERFCKTAVGWVMREWSKIDPDAVHTFLEEYDEWTPPEVVRNATKYMS